MVTSVLSEAQREAQKKSILRGVLLHSPAEVATAIANVREQLRVGKDKHGAQLSPEQLEKARIAHDVLQENVGLAGLGAVFYEYPRNNPVQQNL